MPRRRLLILAEESSTPPPRPIAPAVILIAVVVVALAAWFGLRAATGTLVSPACSVTANKVTFMFSPDQLTNASTIAGISVKRRLPARAATIALATAIQESKLINVTHGDRDSLGLFQQRPSQGWGTEEEVLDPVYATNAFYDALVKVKDYQNGRITEVAQAVQRSAYPEAYADHEAEGRVLASNLTGYTEGGLGCRLPDAPSATPEDINRLAKQVQTELGFSTEVVSGKLVITGANKRQAWVAGQWAVSKAQEFGIRGVRVGPKEWTRTLTSDAFAWHQADAQGTINQAVVRFS